MGDLLGVICAAKREYIAALKARRPLSTVLEDALTASPPRGFLAALGYATGTGQYGLIGEIKRAAPTVGQIRNDFNPARLAGNYQSGGATCISVLTDTPYFGGTNDHLSAARAAMELPVLRKDFIVDPYQIVESRALGADCVVLIMAALDDREAAELEALAFSHRMDAMLLVRDERELERALRLESPLICITNRDPGTLEIDTTTTPRLRPLVPPGRTVVSAGGLSTPEDLAAMARIGVRCFLIGESLMRQPDTEAATRAILAPQRRRKRATA